MDLHERADRGSLAFEDSEKEDSEKEDSEKIELLHNFNKELRPHINNMIGFASLLKDTSVQQNDREHFLDQIISNGDQVLQILENAFQFLKIQTGKTAIDYVQFNISEMVFDVIQTLKAGADQKNIDIHVVFKNPIPETITSDPLKIRQILTNILGNAIRYADEEGFILVSLDHQSSGNANSKFILEIDDSAAGTSRRPPLPDLQKLENIETSVNKKALLYRPGLLLSQKFSEALGGDLVVKQSELGEGNCFSLIVPTGNIGAGPLLKRRKVPSLKKKILNNLIKSNRLKNIRILLAEDSSINEILISNYLNKEGADLTFVNNGLEAIDAVKNKTFDLILMDIQMPLLDGLEATRQIRQLGFQKPILALTGQAFRDDAEKSLMAGCDTHLTKPVKKDLLIEEIQKRVVQRP